MRHSVIGLALVGGFLSVVFVPSASAQIGPDVVVRLEEFAHNNRVGPVGKGVIGAGMGTTSCNKGDEPVSWFQLPDIDHPFFPSNFYRLMTVAGSQRFEQIGQSWVKHGFGTEDLDLCGFGCTPPPLSGVQLGLGCTDTYSSGQAMVSCDLSPRSAFNPYTGVMEGGSNLGPDSGCQGFSVNYPARDHRGHNHGPISHTNQIKDVDLMASHNPGAVYYGESQYIVPHEFVDGNGNQNNNVVHREYRVVGPDDKGLYFFPHVGESVREEPAINKWPGATLTLIEPAPFEDGRAFLAYEATDLGGGMWHYEYALYNMNLDRALQSLSIPIGGGATLSNVEFYAPLNQPHVTHADNYSNELWKVVISGGTITWNTKSFADTYLANAVRWGTLYNFRFDANAPPQAVSATVGLFKTGDTVTAATVSPGAVGATDCNSNGIDDACDLSCDAPCDVPGCGQSADCTGNGIPDECEPDCQPNGVADTCDLASGTSKDCNRNGIPDECDPGGLLDCNGNLTSDYCDVSTGASEDFNANGLPDECDPRLGVIHVDDDAPNDPTPGDPTVSDPLEDGSAAHPFDSIQKGIDVSLFGDVVLVADGVYTGEGNFNISYGGRSITVRSANGPTNCIVDVEFQGSGFVFNHGEKQTARLDGLTIINAANALDEGARFLVTHAGVKCEGGGPTIANCVISSSGGRAVHVNRTNVRIVNCAIHDNVLSVLVIEAGAEIQNCTLANELQGGLLLFLADVKVTNTIIRVLGNESIQIFDPFGSTLDVSYSNVQHGWPGEGNVDVDPLFVDGAGGNFRLTSASPCIDAGDTTVVGALTDCFGAPRSLDDPDTADTGVPAGVAPVVVVDMGAIEFIPADCNDNGVADDLDISGGGSTDANANAIPDECELVFVDCNGNDVPDYSETDCNGNDIPDECDVADLTSNDCNGNAIPDECELGWDQDCDAAGGTDLCDIADGTSQDCNGNGIPDLCDIETPAINDCNDNGIPDECDLWNRTAEDCNANGRLDVCDLRSRGTSDCNRNGIIDECETIPDCNENGLLDTCDLEFGVADDDNGNGVPDECDTPDPPTAPGAPHDRRKNRYVSFVPSVGDVPLAHQITMVDSLNHPGAVGQSAWVGEPDPVTGLATLTTAGPVEREWTESVVHVGGCLLSPVATYEVRATSNEGTAFSSALVLQTIDRPGGGKWWGDTVGSFDGSQWSAAQGAVNIDDAVAVIKKWQGAAGAPHDSVTDVEPQVLNRVSNFNDVFIVIQAFQGDDYPFGCPGDPCQENLADPCP